MYDNNDDVPNIGDSPFPVKLNNAATIKALKDLGLSKAADPDESSARHHRLLANELTSSLFLLFLLPQQKLL